jgi:hypothetical protein
MADKEKYSFIVVKYPGKDTADVALKAVLGLAKEKVVKLRDAATITKTDKGKIKLHQTKDDPTSKGLLKGGGIGVIFALLFGPAGWIVAGAALGGAFATFDRGIKNRLAVALAVWSARRETALGRMADHNFQGEVIVQGGGASGRHREAGGCAADDRSGAGRTAGGNARRRSCARRGRACGSCTRQGRGPRFLG